MSVHPALTKNQKLVFETLDHAAAPLSAYTILDKLRDEGFRAPLQVYRALERLQDYGMVHRLESLNAFVACAHPDCHKHAIVAFAICETCGKTEEFSDKAVETSLGSWVEINGFHPSKMVVEIRGQCRICEAAA